MARFVRRRETGPRGRPLDNRLGAAARLRRRASLGTSLPVGGRNRIGSIWRWPGLVGLFRPERWRAPHRCSTTSGEPANICKRFREPVDGLGHGTLDAGAVGDLGRESIPPLFPAWLRRSRLARYGPAPPRSDLAPSGTRRAPGSEHEDSPSTGASHP